MAYFPGSLLPWVELRFLDDDGNPLAGGFVYFYIAGTSTPQDTYSSSALTAPSVNPNPIELDANGRPPDPIFLLPTGYDVEVKNADDVLQYTIPDLCDPGQVFAANFGSVSAEGSRDVNSGYTQLATDRTVTTDATDATNPFVFNLLAASSVTVDLTIVHFGTGALSVTPNGSDTINGVAAAYSVAAGTSPDFPSITLRPDGELSSNWLVVARAN